jgi:predicted RNase H-like HicB family nuclease
MSLHFKLEYWKDGAWYVGRLTQVPGVFSQGVTLDELEENIRDAYRMMLGEQEEPRPDGSVQTKEIEIPA